HWQGDLALVDVESGTVRRLARGWKFSSFRVAPDGHGVAVFRIVADGEDRGDDCFDLVSVALAGGGVRRLSPRIHQEYGYCFNWSPDSRWIAYFDLELGQASRLFVVPADGAGAPQRFSGDEEMGIPAEEYYLAPR